MKKVLSSLIALSLILLIFLPNAQARETKIKYPILFIDTCDAIGGDFLNSLCNIYDIKHDWIGSAASISGQHLASGAGFPGFNARKEFLVYTFNSKVPSGTPYNAIAFIISVQLISLYWYGSNVDRRINQIKDIIKWAKENGVTIIGMHLDGKEQRDRALGGKGVTECEKLIDGIAPECDILIVNSSLGDYDGNFDGKFTRIAEEYDIDLYTPLNYLACFETLKSLIEE